MAHSFTHRLPKSRTRGLGFPGEPTSTCDLRQIKSQILLRPTDQHHHQEDRHEHGCSRYWQQSRPPCYLLCLLGVQLRVCRSTLTRACPSTLYCCDELPSCKYRQSENRSFTLRTSTHVVVAFRHRFQISLMRSVFLNFQFRSFKKCFSRFPLYKKAFAVRKTCDNPPAEERGMRIFFLFEVEKATLRSLPRAKGVALCTTSALPRAKGADRFRKLAVILPG